MNHPEAEAFLRISERSLRNLVRRGQIPVVRLGGRVLYRRESLMVVIRVNLRNRNRTGN